MRVAMEDVLRSGFTVRLGTVLFSPPLRTLCSYLEPWFKLEVRCALRRHGLSGVELRCSSEERADFLKRVSCFQGSGCRWNFGIDLEKLSLRRGGVCGALEGFGFCRVVCFFESGESEGFSVSRIRR
jgi:hypothetical protein